MSFWICAIRFAQACLNWHIIIRETQRLFNIVAAVKISLEENIALLVPL